jgi:outer membrane immunogenic protein
MSRQHQSMSPARRQASARQYRETTMTKTILLGALGALLLGPATALAADMSMPVKAPPPVVIYDWTGFYLGISGGGSFGGSNHVDPNGANYTADGILVRGGLVGGTVGYNWQMSSLVLGFEGDLSWVGEYGSHNDNNNVANNGFGSGPSVFASTAFQSFTKETWLGTARGRVGYAVNNLLFYATGGYAGAGVTAGINSTVNNASIFSLTSTRSGWTAGGGLEWGFAPNWSAKFEWLYMKFDNAGFTTALGDGPRSAVTLDDNVIRAGINYRFGGPVVAKY